MGFRLPFFSCFFSFLFCFSNGALCFFLFLFLFLFTVQGLRRISGLRFFFSFLFSFNVYRLYINYLVSTLVGSSISCDNIQKFMLILSNLKNFNEKFIY